MENNIIEISGLTKRYGNFTALRDINLNLEAGKIIGLLGPNGSGKTTMIKILTGLLKNYVGDVCVNGNKIGHITKSDISYLPDRSIFGSWMKVKDAIDLYEDFFSDFDKEKSETMLKTLNIDLGLRIKNMSKGMQERLLLVLVMSRNAKLYILDEPIAAVDPATRDYILDTILNNYGNDSTILISTHLIQDVEKIFDTVIFLKEGEIERYGDAEELRSKNGCSINNLFREVFKC